MAGNRGGLPLAEHRFANLEHVVQALEELKQLHALRENVVVDAQRGGGGGAGQGFDEGQAGCEQRRGYC